MTMFELLNQDSGTQARRGVLSTPHGAIQTPSFMHVATTGAVKGITPRQLKEIGAEVILANTYHLLLRPGVDVVERLGGLHKFMAWNGPILTDSGGYQVFSLGSHCEKRPQPNNHSPRGPLTKVDDNGVEFKSHIDGAKIYLNAEIATSIQNRLGADIIMCFDQCTPFPATTSQLKKAVDRTIRWASICKKTHAKADQLLFGIVQGGTDLPLRTYCAMELVKQDFDGYAIGGLSVGEGHENMIKTTTHTTSLLPHDKPRYLMGVGTPADIIAAVMQGIDMFDCVMPTRNGRNAFAFTENGAVRLRNSVHANDNEPIEEGCDCYCCTNFSRGALRHFFNIKEMLGPILVSIHNLRFYQRLMAKIRYTLEKNQFSDFSARQLKRYEALGFLKNAI